MNHLRSGTEWFLAARHYEEDKTMEGYSTLRSRVQRFLSDNPDVQTVTLKRPTPKKRRIYDNSNSECYGRMPESCPILKGILNEHLPSDGTMKIMRDGANGSPAFDVDIESLRDAIFSDIHSRVTSKFRTALEETTDQKHVLLSKLRGYQRQMKDWIEQAETEIPDPPETTESRPRRSRRDQNENIEVEIDESDDL